MDLKNSTVLITGGTSGIGLELVRQLTDQGTNIIVTGRSLEALYDTQRQFPNVHPFRSDVSQPDDIQKLYDEVTKQFPGLNIIINNAGLMRLIDLQDTSLDLQNVVREIDTNLSGTIRMVHQFLPHLMRKESAAIINVSSAIAFMAYSSAPIYSASKAAVHAYTKALRLQLDKTHVKVIEVIPPGVNTNLQKDWVLRPNPGQMMDVAKAVGEIIKGIRKDKPEITPGLSGIVKFMSRIAPNFIERNLGHREFEKFRQLNSHKK
ncbi:SDR family NAD(P)-dependent oxidoreductase [Flavobacterium sp. MAH-1]|uniref:SDR family NAD(P)-dependent oxidoreductase n=1 Tax=Flavobacterium agri TaxID=2743471 RepID=A0A7Y8Y3N2_9FLAO|nr:SDR family NAD(P)-dependent oxidoreductase [Flavobacterium agri]NUY81954.1 SDR family NAD(P)-dependent oxidoreductase [Flavobacterium agri]NYA71978.1 SDR family NAD(P)-dependent oxidoreductase [Flavobacterium agri]